MEDGERAHLVAARRRRPRRPRGGTLRQPGAWRAAAAGNRHHLATDAKLLLLDEPLAGLAEADREVVGRADPPAGGDPRGAADRARHRPRAGAVGPHHRAAPGPADRRRQTGRGGGEPRGDHRLSRHRARRRRRPSRPRHRARYRPLAAPPLLEIKGLRGRLWRQHGARRDRSASCTRARRSRCWAATASARPPRCARSPARCAKSAGRHHAWTGAAITGRPSLRDQPPRHLPGARRAAAVSEPDGDRQPAPRRAARRGEPRRGLRPVPEAARAGSVPGPKACRAASGRCWRSRGR